MTMPDKPHLDVYLGSRQQCGASLRYYYRHVAYIQPMI
jgi:hypothetical protein